MERRCPLRCGFTLLELILVIALTISLTSIVALQFTDVIARSQTAAARDITSRVRAAIQLQRAETGSPPATIDPHWFSGGLLTNPWDPDAGSNIEIDSHATRRYPPQKRMSGGLSPFWYNPANGSFVVRVQQGLSGPEALDLFNQANDAELSSLGQTQ